MSRATSIGAPLVAARFVARPSRFIVLARRPGEPPIEAHLGDPGRLAELLVPDAPLRLRPAEAGTGRRTRFTVTQVRTRIPPRVWVSLEPARANRLAEALLRDGSIRGVGRDWRLRREVACGESRFDFLLVRDSRERLWLEVKAVTCVANGRGRFPDAPTLRGTRHVEALVERVRAGDRAMVLFVALREDVRRIVPYVEIDPRFASALRVAKDAGVCLRGVRFRVGSNGETEYVGTVPVSMPV